MQRRILLQDSVLTWMDRRFGLQLLQTQLPEVFLNKKNLTQAAKSDEITQAIRDLKDISFTYD